NAMLATKAQSTAGNRAAWLSRFGRYTLRSASVTGQFVLAVWATLAVYYSNLPWPWLRLLLAATFAAFSVWALWLTRRARMWLAFGGLFVIVVAWHVSILPSHDRPWRPDVAVMPRVVVEGDRLRFIGVRDFSFRTRSDFTVRYIEREVSLSHLTSVDFFISYWGRDRGPVAHTLL